MADAVWQPLFVRPIRPVEELCRLCRRLLAEEGLQAGGFDRTLTLDLGEWGAPAEIDLHCRMTGQGQTRGRRALQYQLTGYVHGARQHRALRGRIALDVATQALLELVIEADLQAVA